MVHERCDFQLPIISDPSEVKQSSQDPQDQPTECTQPSGMATNRAESETPRKGAQTL